MRIKTILLIPIIFSGILLVRCIRNFSIPPADEPPRELSVLEKQLVASTNVFGFNLFREIIRTEPDTNIFISPLSVAFALGMTANGAAGNTEEAFRQTLGFDGMSSQEINESFRNVVSLLTALDPQVTLELANSIWTRLGFQVEQDFIDVNRTYFDADVRSLDFSLADAPGVINGWVEQKTHGKITEIIQRIDRATMMFLINAVYFKGAWTYEFDPSLTFDEDFIAPDGIVSSCRMMVQEGDFSYAETSDFQAVDLPYGDGKFSMTVFLPKQGTSLDALIQALTPENWSLWMASFSERNAKLYLPKFKVEYGIQLNDVLATLGLGIAFTAQADFTRINREGGLFISEVKHKAFVQVDEERTEAAAVTVVVVSRGSASDVVMRVNRPFLFVIRENHSNTILFIGKIAVPKNE
ncbi:MAG: serpin family protein [bacterium]